MKDVLLRHMTKKNVLQTAKRGLRLFITILICIIVPATGVYAQEEPKDFDEECILGIGCALYDPNSCSGSGGTDLPGGGGVDGGTGIRITGVSAPYILEDFAIQTLISVGMKLGLTKEAAETNAVTEEHVIALLAFMVGEGGDIANYSSTFNPLNTGIRATELIDGNPAANGTQAFKSFDAGVEATARTMVGSNQSRLGQTLIRKDTTANQFMEALTYYTRYQGNFFWAEASLPPNTDSYYRGRLQLVQQVRARYAEYASVQLGAKDANGKHILEILTNTTAKKDKLRFNPVAGDPGDGNTNASDVSCQANGGGIAAGDVVKTALAFAWPNKDPAHIIYATENADGGRSKARPPYQTALPQYNGSKGVREYSDCGVFTSTVMIASGVDVNYPKRGTGVQQPYVERNRDKYNIIVNPKSTADLLPGDILITNQSGIGHTYIYTGPYTGDDGKQYNSASASLALTSFGHPPEGYNWYQEGGYIAARPISNKAPTPPTGGGDVRL